jgi:glycerol-3-phosphate dehydrogenase (NAD+)
MKGHTKPGAVGISLVKGITFENGEIELISDLIATTLKIKCGALMGANIANDVAAGDYCESTLAFPDAAVAGDWLRILSTSMFHLQHVADPAGPELCGTLKNIVAIGGGLVDGIGKGQSTKAAILRQGFEELHKFAQWALPDRHIPVEVMFASCGIGDIIASSYAGRNRRCAEHFAKTGLSFTECEALLLNGQKLQGTLSAADVYFLLKRKGALKEFPFFTTLYLIIRQKVKPEQIFETNGPHLSMEVDEE